MESQKITLQNLTQKEILELNGGGFLYDLYRILKEEGEDFVKGFREGYNY